MDKKSFMSWSIESAIRITLLFLVLLISFLIFKPFLIVVVWSIIIAIAFYPVFNWLKKIFKGKKGLSASILSVLLLSIVILISTVVIEKLIDNISFISKGIKNETLKIPSPPENVKDWPIVGSTINDFWQMSADNIQTGFQKVKPQLKEFAEWLIHSIGGLIGSVFISLIAIIIAGILLTNADNAYSFSILTIDKLVGKNGKLIIDNSRATIQSVVKGVIGVALIQTLLIGIGFWAVSLPGTALLIFLIFILALVQIPPIIIILPIIIYVFSQESNTVAIIFTIYSLIAGASDNFLKPLLLGRGIAIPMLIILIGAIGGMMLMGMVGLFIGPVIFALAYQLFQDWIKSDTKRIDD